MHRLDERTLLSGSHRITAAIWLAHSWWENRVYYIGKCKYKLRVKHCRLGAYFLQWAFCPFTKFSYFSRAAFDGFQAINQFAGWTNMLHSSLSLMKNVIQHFQHCPKCILHFLISLLVERQFTDNVRDWRMGSAKHQANLCKGAWDFKFINLFFIFW